MSSSLSQREFAFPLHPICPSMREVSRMQFDLVAGLEMRLAKQFGRQFHGGDVAGALILTGDIHELDSRLATGGWPARTQSGAERLVGRAQEHYPLGPISLGDASIPVVGCLGVILRVKTKI